MIEKLILFRSRNTYDNNRILWFYAGRAFHETQHCLDGRSFNEGSSCARRLEFKSLLISNIDYQQFDTASTYAQVAALHLRYVAAL